MTARPSQHPERWIGRTLSVRIDRPIGSAHPRFPDLVYPVDYGFVPGSWAADGSEVDAYVLGPDRPLDRFSGPCIAILQRLDDIEDKLVVSASRDLADDEILARTAFQERFFDTRLVRLRPG